MYFKREDYNKLVLRIDGKTISDIKSPLLLHEGWHNFELITTKLSTTNFIKKIIFGWISGLCGAVIYTLDDAFKDIYDRYISFDVFICGKSESFVIENIINGNFKFKIYNIYDKKLLNKKHLKYLILIMLIPLLILCLLLSGVFLYLGFIAIKNKNYFSGFFAILLGIFILFTMVLLINKLKKLFKKKIGDGSLV